MTTKSHYLLLDGLRGVAALMVLLYHLFEAIAFSAGAPEQDMYHGFLAVDFFFVLSGFVMGYAYDDKWGKELNVKSFFKRRLIRLHPMVVFGVIFGLICFIIQGCANWDGQVAPTFVLLDAFVLALFLLPVCGYLDVRGNTELFPLNGPHWSLFFEYIGSIIYALALRKLKTKWLAIWTFVSFVLLAVIGYFGPYGNIAYGWSSDPIVFLGGFLRMNFAYPLGLLLSRLHQHSKSYNHGTLAFVVAIFLLCAVLSVPNLEIGVIYELFAVAFCFPCIVLFAASAKVSNKYSEKVIKFLGNLSYPLYAIHYPLIYLYIWWLNNNMHPFGNSPFATPVAVAVLSIVIGYLAFKFYDLPLRKKLSKKLL